MATAKTKTVQVYYRRTNRPHAFPCLRLSDVEVSLAQQITGPSDNDWSVTECDPDDRYSLDISSGLTEAWLIADALNIEAAIAEHLGMPKASGWGVYDPSDLDDTGDARSYEELCDAVESACGHEDAQAQRIALRSVVSEDYAASHDLDH